MSVSKSEVRQCPALQWMENAVAVIKEQFKYKLHYSQYIFSHYKNSEYDQEIPQSQIADNPLAPRGRAAQPSRDTRKTN